MVASGKTASVAASGYGVDRIRVLKGRADNYKINLCRPAGAWELWRTFPGVARKRLPLATIWKPLRGVSYLPILIFKDHKPQS